MAPAANPSRPRPRARPAHATLARCSSPLFRRRAHAAHAYPRRTFRLAAPVARTRPGPVAGLCAAVRPGRARADLCAPNRRADAARAAEPGIAARGRAARRDRRKDRGRAALGRRAGPAHTHPGRPRLPPAIAHHRRSTAAALCGGRSRAAVQARPGRGGRAQRHARRRGKRPRLLAPPGRAGLERGQRPGPGHRRRRA